MGRGWQSRGRWWLLSFCPCGGDAALGSAELAGLPLWRERVAAVLALNRDWPAMFKANPAFGHGGPHLLPHARSDCPPAPLLFGCHCHSCYANWTQVENSGQAGEAFAPFPAPAANSHVQPGATRQPPDVARGGELPSSCRHLPAVKSFVAQLAHAAVALVQLPQVVKHDSQPPMNSRFRHA